MVQNPSYSILYNNTLRNYNAHLFTQNTLLYARFFCKIFLYLLTFIISLCYHLSRGDFLNNYFIDSDIDIVVNIKQIGNFYYIDGLRTLDDPGSTLDCWQIVYVEEGRLYEYTNGEKLLMESGDFIFHSPGELTKTEFTTSGEPVYACFISFYCQSSVMEFFKNYKSVLSEKSKAIIKNIVREVKNNFIVVFENGELHVKRSPNHSIGSFQMFKIYTESLLINILREEKIQNSAFIFTSKEKFHININHQIEGYLAANIYSSISLDDICKEFNYSKTFLCENFKKYTGVSIINYFNALKIEEACSLIKNTNHSMSDISAMLKFNNPYYFSRVFRRIKGTTPTAYRKLYKK